LSIVSKLLELDDTVVDYIVDAAPRSDEERAALKRLFALHAELHRRINSLLLRRLKLAAAQLTQQAEALTQLANEARAVERKIESIQHMLDLVGAAVKIVTTVVATLV
jgi:hypothetical protein